MTREPSEFDQSVIREKVEVIANHQSVIRDAPALGLPPDADGNGNYAFFDAANYALIQMTGGVTAIPAVQINRSHTIDWGVKRGIMPKIMLASSGQSPNVFKTPSPPRQHTYRPTDRCAKSP